MTVRWQPSLRRISAGTLAIMVVAATLLAGWHHASVTHGRCVEHGEELHLAQVGKLSSVATGDEAQIGASPWAAVEGDEHCQILAAAHQPADTHTTHAITVAHVSIDPVSPPPPSIIEIGVALFRLAPKTSPPVA